MWCCVAGNTFTMWIQVPTRISILAQTFGKWFGQPMLKLWLCSVVSEIYNQKITSQKRSLSLFVSHFQVSRDARNIFPLTPVRAKPMDLSMSTANQSQLIVTVTLKKGSFSCPRLTILQRAKNWPTFISRPGPIAGYQTGQPLLGLQIMLDKLLSKSKGKSYSMPFPFS